MQSTPKRHPRPGPFVPVPTRTRTDGWTPRKQARFLGMLAQTQSVAAAARFVGMTRQTAYRLRRRADSASFAEAWDRALGREVAPRKVTPAEQMRRALEGLLWPIVHRGRFRHVAVKQDHSALLQVLARLDRHPRYGSEDPAGPFKKAALCGPRSLRLTPAAHAPNPPRVCGAGAPSGPPHVPSPVEGRVAVPLAGEGLYPWQM